jgi:hypothetical protein
MVMRIAVRIAARIARIVRVPVVVLVRRIVRMPVLVTAAARALGQIAVGVVVMNV